jgi:hypothetical protein
MDQVLGSRPSPHSALPPIPTWIFNWLGHVDLNHGPIAKYFEHLAHEDTAKARSILIKADQIADELGLDDELLNSLIAALSFCAGPQSTRE